MKKGYLSQYFKGVAAKVLSAVEVDPAISNQHELNGVSQLKKIFGTERITTLCQFLYLDDCGEYLEDNGLITWYDAREAHPTRSEYRLYFPTTSVTQNASPGDILFLCLRPDDKFTVIVAKQGSTISSQLLWLFGVPESSNFSVRDDFDNEHDRIAFSATRILEDLGIPVEESVDWHLEEMIRLFGGKFPSGTEFSSYARSTLRNLHPMDDPDQVIVEWMEREELLFRTLENHLIADRLEYGFKKDVDGFIKYSLSVQNRRKSRAGQAFENHVEQLFISRRIQYDRTKVTENRAKPDFIFPSIQAYCDHTFGSNYLTMLGVKSTCKDRWRQILSEAERIPNKHLLTLEAAISSNQLNEMHNHNVQLVVPYSIHETYATSLRNHLMTVSEFISLVELKQNSLD